MTSEETRIYDLEHELQVVSQQLEATSNYFHSMVADRDLWKAKHKEMRKYYLEMRDSFLYTQENNKELLSALVKLSARLKVENKKRSLKHQLHRKLRRRLEIPEGALSPSWILWLLFPVLMFRKFILKGGN